MLYNILKLLYEHTFLKIKTKCVLFTRVHILQINLKCFIKFDPCVSASIIITIMLLLVISEDRALSLFVKVYIYFFHYVTLAISTILLHINLWVLMNKLQTLIWYFILVTGLHFKKKSAGSLNFKPNVINAPKICRPG